MTQPANILLICSDQHQRQALGCMRHPWVRTPNLDRLAAAGTLYTQAYSNSPICGPSRISFMTGRYLHEVGPWCNCVPWDGRAATWASRLREFGYRTISRGKMDVPGRHGHVGFADFEEYFPRAVLDPWPLSEARVQDHQDFHFDGYMDWPHAGTSREDMLQSAGLKSTEIYVRDEAFAYNTGNFDHDRLTTDQALKALRHCNHQEPWVMHVGLLLPHWPYLCPQKYLDLYSPDAVDLPMDFARPNPNLHPTLQHYQATQNYFQAIRDEKHLRRILAAYYGMITCMDAMLGELLNELDRLGLADNTYVIYTSDHGEALGEHGLFDKLTPYESSVGIPLIVRGPHVPVARRSETQVSLVDLYPTILDCAGCPLTDDEKTLPGRSLLQRAAGVRLEKPDPVFSEYHGIFLRDSWFMLLRGRYKYIYYTGRRPSLFDLKQDPQELNDLYADPLLQPFLQTLENELRGIVDIESVASRATRELAKSSR